MKKVKKGKKVVKTIIKTAMKKNVSDKNIDKKYIAVSNYPKEKKIVHKAPTIKDELNSKKVTVWKDAKQKKNEIKKNSKVTKSLEKKIKKDILASSKKAKIEQDLKIKNEKALQLQKNTPLVNKAITKPSIPKKVIKQKKKINLSLPFKKKDKKEPVKKPVITSTIILTPVKRHLETSKDNSTIKKEATNLVNTIHEKTKKEALHPIQEVPKNSEPLNFSTSVQKEKELEQFRIKKRKNFKLLNWKFATVFILICIFSIIFTFSISKILQRRKDEKSIHNQVVEIQKVVKVEEIPDNDNTEIIEPVEEIPKFNPYWDYINMSLINVDFNSLKETNDHVKGWIQVNGTNINYPFVQANDNKYYLTHSFNKSYNLAGWVFLDYRNDISKLNKNTIIYAHGRIDQTMFGSLKNILTNGFLNDPNNFVVKLSTEYENTLWQVFSVYRIPLTSDYLKTSFVNDKQFLDFAKMLTDRSAHNFDTTVNETDQILTLSTCYNDNGERVVLHAKLIKREIRAY